MYALAESFGKAICYHLRPPTWSRQYTVPQGLQGILTFCNNSTTFFPLSEIFTICLNSNSCTDMIWQCVPFLPTFCFSQIYLPFAYKYEAQNVIKLAFLKMLKRQTFIPTPYHTFPQKRFDNIYHLLTIPLRYKIVNLTNLHTYFIPTFHHSVNKTAEAKIKL